MEDVIPPLSPTLRHPRWDVVTCLGPTTLLELVAPDMAAQADPDFLHRPGRDPAATRARIVHLLRCWGRELVCYEGER